MDQIINQLGLDTPQGPMVLIFLLLMLSSIYSIFAKQSSSPLMSVAFALAVNAVGRHFEFNIRDQYELVFGVLFGVLFLELKREHHVARLLGKKGTDTE
jgi:hypothetical protein